MTPIRPLGASVPPRTAPQDETARLRKTATQMEGMFVKQLFAAMRETIPQDGVLGASPGEELFTSLFDEHIAEVAPSTWHHGLADAIARQMERRLHPDGGAAPSVGSR